MPIIYPREGSATSKLATSTTTASSDSTTLAGPSNISISPTSASLKAHFPDVPLTRPLTSSTAKEAGAASSVPFTALATNTVTSTNATLSQASSQPSQPKATTLPSSLHATATTPSTGPPIPSAFPEDNAATEKATPLPESQRPQQSILAVVSSSSISRITHTRTTEVISSPFVATAAATSSMMATSPTTVGAIRSPASSSRSTLVVVFAVLFGVLCFAVAAYFLYRRLRRGRRSTFNIRSHQPARGIEVHVASSTTEEKVDVIKPSGPVQEEIFLFPPLDNGSTDLSSSTRQSQSQSYDPHEPRAISTNDALYTHHVHGESIGSTTSSSASAIFTPYSGTALFASPATTFTSVSASPQTRRNRFGPSWHYSPRAPPRSASRTSNKLQDARDALLRATWKGHMLSTLLEGDASQRRTR